MKRLRIWQHGTALFEAVYDPDAIAIWALSTGMSIRIDDYDPQGGRLHGPCAATYYPERCQWTLGDHDEGWHLGPRHGWPINSPPLDARPRAAVLRDDR